MTGKKIGVGFIGAGEISILHGIALREIPNAELIGLWNRTPERAVKRAEEERCTRYQTAEELVKDPAIDAVIINTNQETHLKYAKLVMEAGKHLLVEKPVAITVAVYYGLVGKEWYQDALANAFYMLMGGYSIVEVARAIWKGKVPPPTDDQIGDGPPKDDDD